MSLTDYWPWLTLLPAAAAVVLGLARWTAGAVSAGSDAGSTDEPDLDPVSGEPVVGGGAAVASYRGRRYHFNSFENRDRFEANPARFVVADPPAARPGGGHGCC